MENYQEPSASSPGVPTSSAQPDFVYPPKFMRKEEPANIWLKSILSLTLYLVLGYYIFKSFNMLLLITAIVILHELGHFFAMKFYRYNELGIFFIPLLGAYVSGTKREVSQKESAVILLSGPLPGVILGVILYLVWKSNPELSVAGISFYRVSILLILLNLINLLPVYPLDGGQLLNRVFLDEESWISKIFVFLSAALMVWLAWKLNFWVLLIFPAMMLLRLRTDSKITNVEQKIEEQGINADVSYENLSNQDYWKIRNILANEHPGFRDIPTAPPFEFSPKEEKVMIMIQSLLHRHLIQDVSLGGKFLILLICLAAFAAPWIVDMNFSVLRFGF